MKTGKSLTELAQTLTYLRENAKDYIAPTEKLEMTIVDDKPMLSMQNGEKKSFAPSNWAHQQIASYAEIPKAYYEKLENENPALLATNVNHGLAVKPQESRMIRTVGNNLRAFLSSRYRRLDNYDLLETVLPVMIENGFTVESSEITERRLYIKAVTAKVSSEIKVGDTVNAGIVISSSDVGAGSLRVEPLIYRLVCMNGLITSHAIRKYHVGRNQAENDIYELLTDDTKDLTDRAFWAQVKDTVISSMKKEVFEKEVNVLRLASGQEIKNFDLNEVVELSMKQVGVTGEKTKQSIVANLANGAHGAGLTKYGLVNAFTNAAQADHLGYDESTDLERSAYNILTMPQKQWERIAIPA